MSFVIQRFVSLYYSVVVLFICRKVNYPVGHHRIGRIDGFIYNAVRGLYESVFVYAGI